MKLELKIELLKFCFSVLNSIFLVLGLSVGGCALWILFDTGTFLNILSSEELRVVAAGLLMIGGVVMLVSITGCAAANCEKRFLLLVYVVFIIVLILGQLFVSLLLLINRKKIERSLTETVDQIISEYGNDTSAHSRLLDNVQRNSCSQKLNYWLQENILTIIGMDVGLILLQLVLLSISVSLFQMFGRKVVLKRTNQLINEVDAHPDSTPDDHLDCGEQNYTYVGPDADHADVHHMTLQDANNLPRNHDNKHLNQAVQSFSLD